jgi:hypothetical protein
MDPKHFEDRDQADEARFLFGELAGDDFGRAGRLHWIVLHQIAQKDVGIQPDHSFCLNFCVAPVSIAASISSRETGLAGFGMIPYQSGRWNLRQNDYTIRVEEELKPVPRFEVQAFANGFGDGGLSFTAERGFHRVEILHALHFSKSKEHCTLISNRWSSILTGMRG